MPHTSASRGSGYVGDGGGLVDDGVVSSLERIAHGLGEEKWRFSGPVSKISEAF